VPSWFVKVTDFRDRLLAANASTYWVPRHVKDGRFHNWLESARDWCAPTFLHTHTSGPRILITNARKFHNAY